MKIPEELSPRMVEICRDIRQINDDMRDLDHYYDDRREYYRSLLRKAAKELIDLDYQGVRGYKLVDEGSE